MAIDTLVGTDTIILDGRAITDVGYGDVVTIEEPNQYTSMESGKDGNTVFIFQEAGRQFNVKIRVLVGREDDQWLNTKLEQMKNDFVHHVLFTMTLAKQVGDGQGGVITTRWNLEGGVFTAAPSVKYNVSGDGEQAIQEYSFGFARGTKSFS
jgi:hypothetical protein